MRYHVNSPLETTSSSERELRKENVYLWLDIRDVLHKKISLTFIFSEWLSLRNRPEEGKEMNWKVWCVICFYLLSTPYDFRRPLCFFFSLRPLFKWTGLCQLLHPPGRAFLRKVISVIIPSFVNNNNNVSKILNWSRDRFLSYICTERKIYLCDGKVFFTESDWVKLGDN